MIRTPELVPILVAPAATSSRAKRAVLMPADALTPKSGPTAARMISMSRTFAPGGPNPVELLTKRAPASTASPHASPRVRRDSESGLDYHLDDCPIAARADNAGDIVADKISRTRFQRPDIEYHIYLVGAVGHGPLRLVCFDSRIDCTQRKTGYRANLHGRPFELPGHE